MIFAFLSFSCYTKATKQILTVETKAITAKDAVNINTAAAEELEKLPNTGTKSAQRIIEHRTRYGKFRKPEHLLLVQGISDNRFRQIRSLIKTE